MKISKTKRGFKRADFVDKTRIWCSIQESSLADQDAIWLGCNESRMHLDIKLVKELIPLLEYFIKTGYLPDEDIMPKKSFFVDILEKILDIVSIIS